MPDTEYSRRDFLTPGFGIIAILAELASSAAEYFCGFTNLPIWLVGLTVLGALAWKGQNLNENLDPLIHYWNSRTNNTSVGELMEERDS